MVVLIVREHIRCQFFICLCVKGWGHAAMLLPLVTAWCAAIPSGFQGVGCGAGASK